MNTTGALKWLVLLAAFSASGSVSFCQEMSCAQVTSIADLARAKTTDALSSRKRAAGDSYRARVVFAFRLFGLHPKDRNAATLLLDLIPKNEAESTALIALGSGLCDSEAVADMVSLNRVGDSLPREFAKAVLVVPEAMPEYISYSFTAVLDPNNDYALQMQTVCRQARPAFMKGIGTLPPDKKKWFTEHILDPTNCRALALPEAE
jgi:hypothetical protein